MTSVAAPKRPRDRRDTLVAAAGELFARKGYASVGIDDIAAAVGITGPAIYRHFSGKEALLVEVVVSHMQRVAESLERASTDALSMVGAGVSTILDNPSATTTGAREFPRLVEAGGYRTWADTQRRLDRSWRRALRLLNPGLERGGVAIRMAAMLGPYVGVALAPAEVSRPRLDDLCVKSLIAILSSPQTAPNDSVDEPRWRAPSNRRGDILRAAVKLFARRGFNGVGVNEIGDEVGISGARIYHYFDSKADVLSEACHVAQQRVAVRTEDALTAAASADDALRRLVRGYAQVVFEDVDLINATQLEADAVPDCDRAHLERRWEAVRDQWTAVLREARPDRSEAEARMLVHMAFPLVTYAISMSGCGRDRLQDVESVAIAHLRS